MALVAAYNFGAGSDTNARDMAGYRGHGTVENGATYVAGHTDHGINCVSGGVVATFPNGSYYYTQAGGKSVAAWVKTNDSTADWRTVIAKGDRWGLWLSDNNGFVRFEFGGVVVTTTTSVRDGAWHYLMGTFDPVEEVITVYVDAVEVGTGSLSGAWHDGASDLFMIGRSPSGQYADAIIDDVRVWNDPVYPDEVQMFADTPVVDLLLGEYNFDTASGGTVLDHSTYGHHLTLSANGEWVAGHTGAALGPIANSGHAASGNVVYPGIDRLTIMGWVKARDTGSYASGLRLEDALGNLKFTVGRGSLLGAVAEVFRDEDPSPNLVSTDDNMLSTTEWHHLAVVYSPVGMGVHVDSVNRAGGSSGGLPTNDATVTELEVLKVCGDDSAGTLIWDDLRIIKNYLSPFEIAAYMNDPVVTRDVQTATLDLSSTGTLSFSETVVGEEPSIQSGLGPLVPYMTINGVLTRLYIGAAPAPVDTEAPSTPTGLAVTGQTETSVSLSWDASTDNVGVTGYKVYADSVEVDDVATTSATVGSLSPDTTYAFAVAAYDAEDNLSSQSASVNGTTDEAAALTPIAAWAFDEGTGSTAADATGNGNTLTLDPSSSWVTGITGTALECQVGNVDGAGAALACPSTFTIAAWVYPMTYASGGTQPAVLFVDGSGNTQAAIFLQRGDFGPSNVLQGSARINGSLIAVGGDPLTEDVWAHVALTYDGSTIRLYEGGTEVGSTSAAGTLSSSTHLAVCGRDGYAGGANIQMDDLRIYDQVLTAGEIAALMSTPV